MSEDTNSRTLAEAVVGGKAARACDRCVKRRTRWYCAADDAFLCQSCDVTIHSANPLARRHDRVRLNSSSFSGSGTWHHGFTRKPRTPRKSGRSATVHDIVPEIGIDNDPIENNFEEERLFYQVPEFDSAASEKFVTTSEDSNGNDNVESCLDGFFPTDKELAEFAADVETLFGKGPENESFLANSFELKVEVEDNGEEEVRIGNNECFDHEIAGGESLDLSFDYDSRASFAEEDDEKKVGVVKEQNGKDRGDKDKFSKRSNNKKDLMLSLDYESVIATWNGQSPPWIADGRPELDPDDQFWPACPCVKGEEEARQRYGVGLRMRAGFTDEGREARVMRYREKRRTRLFSKKIRYEVRKLNAEKRPRMKGRFVKRSAFAQLSK